ncbi:MAG: GNAT family N-acetyltransferase [Gammaproteobacteria bacterium]|nr:GNAT family N-acetyltransferase [Gammaproteobacteria bacterium]
MQYTDKIPDKSEFYPLYVSSGWNQSLMLSAEQLEQAVKNSFSVISVYENNQLIGFGRIVSDGVVYATIYDVIVSPNWQKQGIGSTIVRKLVSQCEFNDIRSIHLFAAKGAENFYKNLGFASRPFDSPGMVYEKI